MEDGLKALDSIVRDFVENLYQEYHIADLLRSDPQGARNAVEVAFEELKAALFVQNLSIRGREELAKLIHAHVSPEHRFLFDDVIEWDSELEELIQTTARDAGKESQNLSPEDWEAIKEIAEGRGAEKRKAGFSLDETARALNDLDLPRRVRGLSVDEVAGELEDLVPREELSQPKKIWERLMGCRHLPPHDYKTAVRRILKAWKRMWDEEDRDDTEFHRFVYFMLRLSGDYLEDLRGKREDPTDMEVQRASHLNSALQIFSAHLSEDLARKGRLGRASLK